MGSMGNSREGGSEGPDPPTPTHPTPPPCCSRGKYPSTLILMLGMGVHHSPPPYALTAPPHFHPSPELRMGVQPFPPYGLPPPPLTRAEDGGHCRRIRARDACTEQRNVASRPPGGLHTNGGRGYEGRVWGEAGNKEGPGRDAAGQQPGGLH